MCFQTFCKCCIQVRRVLPPIVDGRRKLIAHWRICGHAEAHLQCHIQHSQCLACAAISDLRCFVKCHHGQGFLPCACEMTDMNTSITHGSCKPPVSRPSLRHSTNASLGCNFTSCSTRCMPSNFKSPSVAGPTFAMSDNLIGRVVDAAPTDTRAHRRVAKPCVDFFVPAIPQA